MSNILAYRYSSAASGSTHTQWMVPLCGFAVSGVKGTSYKEMNVLGVCCFDYDYSQNVWIPKSH